MNFSNKLYKRILADTEKYSELPIQKLIDTGITDINQLRKWLVKKIYYEEKKKKEKSLKEIKLDLSVEYEISVSSIEKLVYGRRW